MVSPAKPTAPDPPRHTPHFEISVEDSRGSLMLRPCLLHGWLHVERLEMAIPNVSFPLDITGGMAQFQRQRCPVVGTTFSVEAAGLAELVSRRVRPLSAAGFDEISLDPDAEGITVSARVRVRERTANMALRLALVGHGRTLHLRVEETATFGWLRRPSTQIAHDLVCILFGAIDTSGRPRGDLDAMNGPVVQGVGEISLRPLELFAESILSPAGWRLPDLSQVQIDQITTTERGLRLTCAQTDREPAALAPAPVPPRVSELLLRNDLAGAIAACREASMLTPDHARALTKLSLDLLLARDGSLRDAELLARDTLLRWPDFFHAQLALGTVAIARGRDAEVSQHFAEAARLAESAGHGFYRLHATLAAAHAVVDQDPTRAMTLYAEAAKQRPGDERVVDALAELYTRNRRWPELARLYESQVAGAIDGRAKARAHLRLGEVLATRLDDVAGAQRELEAATRLDATLRRGWELRADVAARAGDRAGAIAALEQSASLLSEAGDPIARARTIARIGTFYEELGNVDAARERYRSALALMPDDPGILNAFAMLAETRHDLGDALEAYERLSRCALASPEVRRTAQSKLLRLFVQVHDLAGARRAFAERHHDPDVETLMQLARLEEGAGELAAAVELIERATPYASGPRAAELELERARLLGATGDGERAHTALLRAHELAPEGPAGEEAARRLLGRAQKREDHTEEARWLDDLIGRAPPDLDELRFRRAVAHQLAGDATSARRLLDLLPEAIRHRPDIRRLHADVLGALGDPGARAATLESLADGVGTAEERAMLLLAAADAQLDAGDIVDAQRLVTVAETLTPSDPRVRVAVANVAWRRRSWEEVVTLYDELFHEARGNERTQYGHRLGEALARIGRPAEALTVFEQIVAAEDAGGPALTNVWRARAEAYERAGEYARAAENLRAAALDPRTTDNGRARADLLRDAAGLLHRRAGAPQEAAELLEEVLRLQPDDLITLDALESLWAELGDSAQVRRTLERKLAVPGATHEQRLAALARLAELVDGSTVEEARRQRLRILELHPQHEPSLRWLAEDAWQRSELEEAARHLSALLSLRDLPPDESRTLRLRLAELAERRGDAGEAEVHLWSAAELSSPHDKVTILERLERLYVAASRWSDAVMVLLQSERLVDEVARGELRLRRIDLLLHQLHTPEAAREAIREALAHDTDDVRLLKLAVETARALDDGTELVAALHRLVLASGGEPSQATVALLTGALDEHLSLLSTRGETLDETGRALFDLLRRAAGADESGALADALSTAAGLAADATDAAAWLVEAAHLRRQRGDLAGAADALERAVELAPTRELLTDLETILTDAGDFTRLKVFYEEASTRVGDAERLAVLDKLIRLNADVLGDQEAAQHWRDELARSESRNSTVSMATLVRTVAPAHASSDPDSELGAEERKLASLPPEQVLAIRQSHLRLGQLQLKSGNYPAAREHLETVLAEDPSNKIALEAFIEAVLHEERWADAADGYERLSHLLEEPELRADALHHQGELLLLKLGDKERATDAYLKAIDLAPTYAPTVRRLVDYFWSVDDRDSVVEMVSALDDAAFGAADTATGTKARGALAVALANNRRALRLTPLLGPGGAVALARAVADALGRNVAARALVQAVRLLCGNHPDLLTAVRDALSALTAKDARLRAIVSEL
jgi:tetratricopeptide (TPR) repeat protein